MLLISNINRDLDFLYTSLRNCNCSVLTLLFWEQVDELTVNLGGNSCLVVERQEILINEPVLLLDYPTFAEVQRFGESDNFVESEWQSALTALLWVRRNHVLNGNLLVPSLNMQDASYFLCRDIMLQGWPVDLLGVPRERTFWVFAARGIVRCYPAQAYQLSLDEYFPHIRTKLPLICCCFELDFLILAISSDMSTAVINRVFTAPTFDTPKQLLDDLIRTFA